MKKFIFPLILFAIPNNIFCMKKKQISMSNDSHQFKKNNEKIFHSENILLIKDDHKDSLTINPKSLTPFQARRIQKKQEQSIQQRKSEEIEKKINQFKEHTKCHDDSDIHRQYTLDPKNKEIVNHCIDCLLLHKFMHPIKVNN